LTPPFFGLFSTRKVATHHFSFCRYDSIKIASRQARGLIPHTSQEWQSNLIGIDSATKIRAFQNKVCASSPITAPDFPAIHAAIKDKTLTPHRPFQSRHLKCFLFIKMLVNKIRFIDLLLFYHMIKKFSFPQIQNMIRADVFLRVLLRFLSVRLRRISDFSRGDFLAACGGENGSDYFKNTAHFRKWQARGSHLASLGGHFVLNFGGKNELAVSFGGKKIF